MDTNRSLSDESSGDSFVTKGVFGQSTTCSIASTSSLGCLSDRSSSIPSPRHFQTPPPEYGKRHRPYPCVSSARQSRAAHNELEKTRRANLRGYLDNLKDIVPSSSENVRNTTLSLLTRARDYILELDKLVKSAEERRQQLEKRHSALQLMMEGLSTEKTLIQESHSESVSTTSAVDDNDYGVLSSYASSSSSLTFSDSTSCLDFGSKLSVSSSNSSLVNSPIHPYPPFDPYLNGLLPALPLCYPRISMYPYLDVQPL